MWPTSTEYSKHNNIKMNLARTKRMKNSETIAVYTYSKTIEIILKRMILQPEIYGI
jgi:hypothetical protein